MLAEYVPLLWLLALCAIVVVKLHLFASWFGPTKADPDPANTKGDAPTAHTQPFESGSEPTGSARGRATVNFALAALIFIAFFVAAILLIPWAIALPFLGGAGLSVMLMFLAVLAVGLIYVWKSGVFEWD